MGNAWRKHRKSDPWYKKAKQEGYLARSAYKLKQIDRKYGVLGKGKTVVDLGAAPGGWSQVALEAVGPEGTVIAVDLKSIDAQGVIAIRGDVTQEATLDEVREAAGGPVDTVLSDMAPRISGNYDMDHARSVHLAHVALEAASELLAPRGAFVVKVFQGDLFKDFYDAVGERFAFHRGQTPKATRKGSSEAYVIGKGYKPQ